MVEHSREISQATVLIVEDDPTLLSTLAYNLRREGYRVIRASDGETGLELARNAGDSLDLVLLDLMLPGMSGFDVLRALRTRSDVPVLILSARGAEQDKIDGLELGADDYIVKPFALRELQARIRAAVRRRSIPEVRPPTVLYRGAIEVEPDRRVARANDQELQLRPKEFGLLATLAMEPGRVFSRQELLDRIWGEEIVVDERTVDVHVSWLRGKLVQAGISGDVIKTIYGAGYRFISPAANQTPPQQSGDSFIERVAL